MLEEPRDRSSQEGYPRRIGAAPWVANISFARLKGREPKSHGEADNGLGCALVRGVSPSQGATDWASRPQRMATKGAWRADSAATAAPVMSSHPSPM